MIDTEKLVFRKLDFAGLQELIVWARLEGWNPGEHDAKAFWATDPEGFYGFYLDDTLVGGGAIISYGGKFGFMGLFIVSPAHRSRGIGRKLWYKRRDLLIGRLDEGSPIGMDGVVSMQSFYQKGGFTIAYTAERYERHGARNETDPGISVILEADFDQLAVYDRECFGFPREDFLKSWINLPETKSFKFSNENRLMGYAVVRKAGNGYKIGPLFADTPVIAEKLYMACLNSAPKELFFIDIPTVNKAAMAMIRKQDARYVFECARMYYGTPPQINTDKIYGVTTFELG